MWNRLKNTNLKQLAKDLWRELGEDRVSDGAAALAFYWLFALFPSTIFMLTLLPYLPIPRLEQALMDLMRQALPEQAADLFSGVVKSIVAERRGGLLSLGLLIAVWSASSGMHALMQQLNVVFEAKEERPTLKSRGIALLLTLSFAVLVIGAFALIVSGGILQTWLGERFGWSDGLLLFFASLRWVVIFFSLLLGVAVTYRFGPNVQHRFRLLTAGSLFAVLSFVLVSLGFRVYVVNFGSYDATYGSIGAVIILLLWLYLAGGVILLGAEIDSILLHTSARAREGNGSDRSLASKDPA